MRRPSRTSLLPWRFAPSEQQRLFGLTIAIGGVCGLVAVAFHESIRWIGSLTIDRAFAAPGDAWIPLVIVGKLDQALLSGVIVAAALAAVPASASCR